MKTPRLPSRYARRIPAALVLGVAAYYALWGGEYSAFDIRHLRTQRTDATVRLTTTTSLVDSLELVVAKLEKDATTIETVARERFGMIRDGELLYRFVPIDPPAASGETRVSARSP
jgi:cell division protein FtsB